MTDWTPIGRWLVITGIGLILVGGTVILGSRLVRGRVPWLGHLPGDIRVERRGMSCYFPLATSIVISLLLTIVLNVVIRLLRRQ
jgi:hypothetical protein